MEEIINLNIGFFNIWTAVIKVNKQRFNLDQESFLEKSLGLSVGYRVMQLLYSYNMYKTNNKNEILISLDILYKELDEIFHTFFELNLHSEKYPTGDDGMTSLFMDLTKILYEKNYVSDNFLEIFLPKAMYLLLVNRHL